MGRSKAAPVQKQMDPDDDSVMMLGCRTLDSDSSVENDTLFAAEVEHDRGIGLQNHGNSAQGDDNDEDDEFNTKVSWFDEGRVRIAVEKRTGDPHRQEVIVAPSNPSRLAAILAKIECEEAEKAANKKRNKQKKLKKQRKPAKSLSFADAVVDRNLVTHIPPPEIQIVNCRETTTATTNGSHTYVYYNRRPEVDVSSSREDIWWLLGEFTLVPGICVVLERQSKGEMLPGKLLDITTKQGAVDVWNLLVDKLHVESSLSLLRQRRDSSQAIGRSVQAGTLRMQISPKEHVLRVGITCRAVRLCTRDQLPLQARSQRRTKQFHLATDLHRTLAALFPDSEIADTILGQPRSTTREHVTAKQVYALTDNVQLKAALDHEPSVQLSIPGLVPTLRPYQAKAVEWMLQREKGDGQNGDEWKLAWFVIAQQDKSTDEIYAPPRSTSMIKWKDQRTLGGLRNTLFFCPFTGWLAESIDQARMMTVGPMEGAIKGGILAESMGLGKTVEVIACILAHPFVKPPPQELSAVARQTGHNVLTPSRRRLDFDGRSTPSKTDTQTDLEILPSSKAGYLQDMNEFGDADDDMEEDDNAALTKTVAEASHNGVLSSSTTSSMDGSGYTQCNGDPVPFTPERDDEVEGPIEVRWLDDEIVGACICGALIGFSSDNGPGSVVVCRSCDEPMHMHCAAFVSNDEMNAETKPIRFRQRFSNVSLDCRICYAKRCPCCVAHQESGATLIVTPPSIIHQWERELQRHARRADGTPVRVVVYDGIKRLSQTNSVKKGSLAIKYMHPGLLANADIVLMTFDALLSDLGHTDDNQFVSRISDNESRGNLRSRKRYRVVPSPLLSIKWWRVCLDEAQRVETPTVGSAQMALKLEATHRWCVSGTPVGRGKLEDLFGLLVFLRLDPFWNKLWFRKCFHPTHRNIEDRIKHLLANVFWRSTKNLDLVRDQMGVPEQIEKKITLQFSSIEKHFYDRQLEQTLSAAGEVVDCEGRSNKRKSPQVYLLTDHLHKLRAACCHPQVGSSGVGTVKKTRTSTKWPTVKGDVSVSSRVMTMSQILDKFIDDAKTQCEEAQRLALLHTNGMAATSKLKVEAKQLGVAIVESERALLEKSCNLYLESIRLADANADPTLVLGEASVGGSVGFRSPRMTVQQGAFCMDWKLPGSPSTCEPWSRIDFTLGPARKITQLRVRVNAAIPQDVMEGASMGYLWRLVYPKDCVFQCLSVSGEFVNVHAFSLPLPGDQGEEWALESGFRTNKSKSWRFVVKSFHMSEYERNDVHDSNTCGMYMGIDAEFYEATIASDHLQRLHCLHNAALSFTTLLQLQESAYEADDDLERVYDVEEVREKVDSMTAEANKIESLYLDAARAVHNERHKRLNESASVRNDLERELLELTLKTKKSESADCWDDMWWDDFLVMCHLYGSEAQHRTLCDKLLQDLDGVLHGGLETVDRTGTVPFPVFGDITGLRTALQMRIQNIRSGLGNKPSRRSETKRISDLSVTGGEKDTGLQASREGRFKCTRGGHGRCMHAILDLTPNPSEGEMLENSRCKICKADWFQTGPKCRHCKIGEDLEDLTPDKVTMLILSSMHGLLRGSFGAAVTKSSKTTMHVVERAKKFFDIIEAAKKEKIAAWRLWRSHLDLLNDLDELNQCKRAMRLTYEGEDVTALTEEELNAVVVPIDICTRFHDHAAKQAMALGALSRAKGTLQYLKNLSAAENQTEGDESQDNSKKEETCIVCLSTFDTNRAVLRCGHSFHLTPCLEKLRCRSGGAQNLISCPLRCLLRTDPTDVLIASEKCRDDGSHSKRRIKGSYGTKVTRLVSDILEVCDLGEKSLVFSQWDDMLSICEQALAENGVQFVRVASLKQIGDCTRRFREPDCSVILLNVKNGAEGLTLLEATHVFMIEPLLNCGLDSQGKNQFLLSCLIYEPHHLL